MQQDQKPLNERSFRIPATTIVVFLLAMASLLPIMQTWSNRQALLNDDSLITLTFSRNLGEGKGFIYNAPPPILGTTTPLWAMLCALGHVILPTMPLPSLAIVLSGLFWLASIWTLFAFQRDFDLRPPALLAAAVVLASLNWPAALGMEAFLFLFLLLLACGLFFRTQRFWSGFVVALLFLTRGEGILLLGVQLAWLLIPQGLCRKPCDLSGALHVLAGFAIPFFAWAAFALPTFHQVLPGTLGVKIAQARSGLWPSFWQQLRSEWLPGFMGGWRLGAHWLNGWFALAILGIAVIIRRRRPMGMVLAWLACYVAGYSFLGVAAYGWYMIPIAWGIGLAAAEGTTFLSSLPKKWRLRFLRGNWIGWGIIAAFAAALVIPAARAMKTYRPHPKCQTYLEICRWIGRNTSPGQSIAYFEVGYLGFYTRNPIVDQMGLVTPGGAPNIARRDFSSSFWLHKPDYFLVYSGSGFQYHIVTDPRFQESYRQVARFPGWGENPLVMFKRL